MSPQETVRFRELIAAQLAQVELDLTEAGANAGTVMLDQSSVGRLSRMDAMQQQAMAASQRTALQRRQQQLQAALKRLENGSFGACCQCGEGIALPRLLADPGTPFCADCREARERGGD
ncbi:MAG: TraR/DksA C4-type zinc finger protein [Nitrosomonadales bacterium]|nr:TraR/DksA C4-type zinc finger protein [Nitrosomonadales bacterium]